MDWQTIVNLILVLIPVFVGAKFRSMRSRDEKYYKAGTTIQMTAILCACVLFTFDFIREIKGNMLLYIAYGITAVVYLSVSLYVYFKIIKK